MSPIGRLTVALRHILADEAPRRASRRARSLGAETLEPRAMMTASPWSGGMRGMTNPAAIEASAAAAYVWGLAPEFVQRFSTYNTTISAPINALNYGAVPAAWNDPGTNAGDASVLYINSFIDFSKTSALVLTVPPSRDQYYVVSYLDDYINTIGSIGTRTTPSDEPTSYLLVGPDSPLAKDRSVDIHGYRYQVLASDTNLNWMLIRVGTNTLADASDPGSVPSVYENVVKKFALNTLQQFEQNGRQPVFPTDYATPEPTPEELIRAKPYQNTPQSALEFFNQLGTSVKNNPIPTRFAGLSGSSLKRLPSHVVPQYNAKARYIAPAYGQQGVLRSFAGIGLSANGFRVPRNRGPAQVQALQSGYEKGQQLLNEFISGTTADASSNYWTILNTIIGTYPNNTEGYLYRAAVVINGGSANVPLDAVYPNVDNYQGTTPFNGNNTYSITFTPPDPSSTTLPADGVYPPMVTDERGDPRGFWAITLYQPDPTEVAAPFLSQASVLNTSSSAAADAVVSVDPTTDVLTVRGPSWGTLKSSTPILFGDGAAAYGLTPSTVYYVAAAPTTGVDATGRTTYSFQVSAQWLQTISPGGVPIQYSGGPGPIVDLQQPTTPTALAYGVVKPVSQLGSAQLSAGQLAKNADGSLTIWVGPTLPAGAPASNWIPTPSTAYFESLYPGQSVSTTFQLMMRMYYPTPGDAPPSILPYNADGQRLPESYIPPAVVLVNQGG